MTTTDFFEGTKKIGEMIVEHDLDFLQVITGRERIGKSTLALKMASEIDPNFKVSQIVFDVPNLYKQIYSVNKGQVIIIDEGATAFFAREAMSKDVKEGIKLLTVMGERNLFVILCVPNFFIVDKYIRQNRVSALAKVVSRGRFKYFSRSAIRRGHFNPKTKGYNWGTPTFKGTFGEMKGKLWNDYCTMKSEYLMERKSEYSEEATTSKWIPVKEGARMLDMKTTTLRLWCREGKVESKANPAGRWLISVNAVNILESGEPALSSRKIII